MLLEWWNYIVRALTSETGRTILVTAVFPFLGIIVAGIIATVIARGSVKRLIAQQDRHHQSSAVAGLISAGRKAATWGTLTAAEKDHVDHQVSEAEVRVRLLPLAGAGLAADWASHQLASMKANSTNYSFQADQDLVDFQDGLIAWQAKPGRARKLFAQDLAAWKYEAGTSAEADLGAKQREWQANQSTEATSPIPSSAKVPTNA